MTFDPNFDKHASFGNHIKEHHTDYKWYKFQLSNAKVPIVMVGLKKTSLPKNAEKMTLHCSVTLKVLDQCPPNSVYNDISSHTITIPIFIKIRGGHRLSCVDLTWNDPYIIYKTHIIYRTPI